MRANWTETALGVVATLGNGGAWGADEPGDGLVDAACLRGTDLADLINGEQPAAPVRWLKESELTKARCVENMILIETSGSKCGRSVLLTKKMLGVFERPVVFSNFCRTLRIDLEKIMNKYAELWFSHAYATGLIPSYRATSAMPNLDIKSLLRIEKMLIPPLSEQKRIVDIMVSVDAYIAALQQQADDAGAARNAVLHELLTAGGSDWAETTLGEVASWHSGGTPKTGEPEFYENGTIPWVVIADMLETDIFNTASKITLAGLAEIGGKLAPKNSVLISMYATVGRPGYAHMPVATNQAIAWSIPNVEIIHSRFLLLVAQYLEPMISSMARGATQRNINRAMLREFSFLLPPLSEQQRIVEIVSAMDDVVSATEKAVSNAHGLRSGLLSSLLTGDHEIPEAYDRLLGAA